MYDGKKIKSYQAFEKDFLKINKKYNTNYLNAEYEYAVQSSIMADKYDNMDQDDKYLLQYRTAADSRVREEHQALHNVTLPKNDPFWNDFYPPNGWNCRCTVVEVLPNKYPKSDSKKAIENGKKATTQIGKNGKNKLEIFRMNPGKDGVIFPKDHPYYPKHCKGSKLNLSGLIDMGAFVLSAEKNRCRAVGEIERLRKIQRRLKDKEIKQWSKRYPAEGKEIKAKNFKTGSFIITRKNIKSINDHFTNIELKDMTKEIELLGKKSQYVKKIDLDKSKDNYERKVRRGVQFYRYYKVNYKGINLLINVEVINNKELPYAISVLNKK